MMMKFGKSLMRREDKKMLICEECKRVLKISKYKDRRGLRSSKDSTLSVSINKCLCLHCTIKMLSQIVADYKLCGEVMCNV